MAQDLDEFIPTRRSLLSRLKHWDDQESWRDFFSTYWKLLYSVAIKAGFSEHEAEEVVQETIVSVARHIQEFKYDPSVCSFKTWPAREICRKFHVSAAQVHLAKHRISALIKKEVRTRVRRHQQVRADLTLARGPGRCPSSRSQ